MLANWIHIVIVHLSILGTPWICYRVYLNRKTPMDDRQWKVTYSGLILLAIITAIAYFTGPETADYTKEILTNFPQDHVENHALWGRIAFVIQVLIGLLGIMAWASILQEEKPESYIYKILLVLLFINTFVLFYTAHLGGLIRRLDLMQKSSRYLFF